jgi:hypothetical protein
MTKNEIIELIDERIESEYINRKDGDWKRIAAHKIYASLKHLIIDPTETLPLDFVKWYSGMETRKIMNAFNRYNREKKP